MKANDSSDHPAEELPAELAGLRMTRQRREVYSLLLQEKDHPTANEIFLRAQERVPGISLATVYNVLEALTAHNLVKQVNFEREPSRYCSNPVEHGHFHDTETGTIHDITFKKGLNPADFLELPAGAEISSLELTLRGKLHSKTSN
ncbi:MAG: Fur family transcriptional regulator [Verrucomicrobiales bacterium]